MKLDYTDGQAFQAELKKLARSRQRLVEEIARIDRHIEAVEAAAKAFARVMESSAEPGSSGAAEDTEPQFEITGNIREILKSAKRDLYPREIRDLLIERGWSAQEYRNPLAVVHTILKRLIKDGDAQIRDGSEGKAYSGGYTAEERRAMEDARQAEWRERARAQAQAEADRAEIRRVLPGMCLAVLKERDKAVTARGLCQLLEQKGLEFPGYKDPVLAVHRALRTLPVRAYNAPTKNGVMKTFYELERTNGEVPESSGTRK